MEQILIQINQNLKNGLRKNLLQVNNYIIKIPETNKQQKSSNQTNDKDKTQELKDAVKKQYKEIKKIQNQEINEKNQDVVDDLIMATEDLINNCIKEKLYNVNRDQNFLNATVICNRLSLKLESFKINNLINKLNEKTEELAL